MTRKLVVGNVPRKVRPPTTVLPPTEAAGSPSQNDVTSGSSSTQGTIPMTMPTNVAGDRIYIGVSCFSLPVDATPSGWTALVDGLNNGGGERWYLYRKDITSTIGSVDIDTTGSGQMIWCAFTVKNPGTETVSSTFAANTNIKNPPAVTPTTAPGDHLVFTFNWSQSADGSTMGSSTGYTDVYDAGVTGFGSAWMHIQKQTVAIVTTEDPDSYTFPSTATGVVSGGVTVAIAGGAATVAAADHTHDTSDVSDVAAAANLGEVLVSDGDSWETLTVGSDDQVLTADSGEALGVKWAAASGGDHGGLTGLTDDDHTQYALADGTRAFTGDQSMGSNKLTNVTDPTSAQDAATKAYVDANAGSELLVPDVLENPQARFTATAAQTIANTVTETTLFGSGEGALTFPANFFQAGEVTFLTLRGQLSDTGTPNFTIKLKLGSTVICSVGPTALTGVSSVEFLIELMFTCRSAGASGSFIGGGLFDYDDGTELSLSSGSAVSIDTTAAQTLDVTWEWGTADASNTITVQEGYVDSHDPQRVVNQALGPLTNDDEDDFLYSDAI